MLNIKPIGDKIYNILKVIIGRGRVRLSSLIAMNKNILAKINWPIKIIIILDSIDCNSISYNKNVFIQYILIRISYLILY